MAVGKPALKAIPPPTGMECEGIGKPALKAIPPPTGMECEGIIKTNDIAYIYIYISCSLNLYLSNILERNHTPLTVSAF